ncbi:substrate-binding periplasmic protein [Shewanella aquimarina]|uniref:substrate-binding periplasmic protein n=1 Tax=Shewanella aquimarina TaxID=260365 RepID=UPI002014FCF6|nr:transporter substrate-binding domain-containing protein [Shewanella aquimarina]MCL2909198.1 transporter substrate-binding domain-containing protein [Shewanella aquimarina]
MIWCSAWRILLIGLSLIYLSLLGLSRPVGAAPLRMLTEEWAPMSYQEQGLPMGYGVSLVRRLASELGEEANIEVLPWARAFAIAEGQANVLLFATSRNEQRSRNFDFVGPIATTSISIYAKAEDRVTPTSVAELDALGSVGVYRGSLGESILMRQGVEHLTVASFPQQSARQLQHDRIRFWCQADLAVARLLDEVNMGLDEVHPVLELAQVDLYLAFSKGTDPERVLRWHDALAKLQASGEMARLYHEWFPKLTPPHRIELLKHGDLSL